MTGIDSQSERTTEPRIGRSVSLDDAALRLGVSRRTIYNRIREGRLQTIRTPGGSQRVLIGSMPLAGAAEPWRAVPLTASQTPAAGSPTVHANQ